MDKNTAIAAKSTVKDEILKTAADIAPAKTFSTSGAPVQVVPDVDPDHPAIDNDPRKGTTVLQNKIDMNDPTITGSEAVEQNLKAQSKA